MGPESESLLDIGDETIAVIGSGIVGSLSARELAAQGYKVHLIEENEDLMMGTSAKAVQLHLGGLYSGDVETALECLRSSVVFKQKLPYGVGRAGTRFLVAGASDMPLDEYIAFYNKLVDEYATFPKRDQVWGEPEDLYKIMDDPEYAFAKGIDGGLLTAEPLLNMGAIKTRYRQLLAKLSVTAIYNTEVLAVRQSRGKFLLTIMDKQGIQDELAYDQVVNAGGYKCKQLDSQLGDEAAYHLQLKAWNIIRPRREILPPFYVVRGDFMHHSPFDINTASLIVASNEGSYIDACTINGDESVPADWQEILQTGAVPAASARDAWMREYTHDTFLPKYDYRSLGLMPGVAVSYSNDRQNRQQQAVRIVVPGWQTAVPTKVTNAVQLAANVADNALRYTYAD